MSSVCLDDIQDFWILLWIPVPAAVFSRRFGGRRFRWLLLLVKTLESDFPVPVGQFRAQLEFAFKISSSENSIVNEHVIISEGNDKQ